MSVEMAFTMWCFEVGVNPVSSATSYGALRVLLLNQRFKVSQWRGGSRYVRRNADPHAIGGDTAVADIRERRMPSPGTASALGSVPKGCRAYRPVRSFPTALTLAAGLCLQLAACGGGDDDVASPAAVLCGPQWQVVAAEAIGLPPAPRQAGSGARARTRGCSERCPEASNRRVRTRPRALPWAPLPIRLSDPSRCTACRTCRPSTQGAAPR